MTNLALGVDDAKTAANRPGHMTPEQQQRFSARVEAEARPLLVVTGCFVGFSAILLWTTIQAMPAGGPQFSRLLVPGFLSALALIVFGVALRQRARNLAEVQAGLLQRTEGHVVWRGGAYCAQVPDRTLALSGFRHGLGTYIFSFLPRSGRVVDVELVRFASAGRTRDELRHALAVTNHFNVDDLPAFREGHLRQAGALRLRRAWAPAAGLFLSGLASLVFFVLLASLRNTQAMAPVLFVTALVLGFAFLVAVHGEVNTALDLLSGQVASEIGEVRKSSFVTKYTGGRGGGGRRVDYFYRLGSHVWTVGGEAYGALIDGQMYRVYFLPRSQVLLAIEPI